MDTNPTGWKSLVSFKGRTQRFDYWAYYVISSIMQFILTLFATLLVEDSQAKEWVATGIGAVMVIPFMAFTVRRMHDVGRSGWWSIVPIVSLIFCLLAGTRGQNRFGPDPKRNDMRSGAFETSAAERH